MKYVARFTPQAWIKDYAVDVDPEGPTEWETKFEGLSRENKKQLLDAIGNGRWNGLDHDDLLKEDPAAPEWVREWSGPFSIYLRKEDGFLSEHNCPCGSIEEYRRIDVGEMTVQIGICPGCQQVIARRYLATGSGTGPWTVLRAES